MQKISEFFPTALPGKPPIRGVYVVCGARVCPDYYTGDADILEPVSCSNKIAREKPVTRTVNHDRTTTSEDRTPGRNLKSLVAAN